MRATAAGKLPLFAPGGPGIAEEQGFTSSNARIVEPFSIRRCLRPLRRRVEQIYRNEMNQPGSPITQDLVILSLNHIYRVVGNAAAIAAGEKLDTHLLELAAVLHDCAKLDHRKTASGGVDTWHHHRRGAAIAAAIIRDELRGPAELAEKIAQMIERHSHIPFIRRYWDARAEILPEPISAEDFALRDADVIDTLWVGGLAKIIRIRQIPGSDFFKEDGGEIRKAIASARRTFEEAKDCLESKTARLLARERIQTVESFLAGISGIESLDELNAHCRQCVVEKETVKSHPYH